MSGFINTFDTLKVSGQLMNMLSKNQSIITNNLTNIDTPDYQAQNTNFREVMGTIQSPIMTDLAQKMGPPPLITNNEGKVDLEKELLNMQVNNVFYTLASKRAGKVIAEIKSASQVGR